MLTDGLTAKPRIIERESNGIEVNVKFYPAMIINTC